MSLKSISAFERLNDVSINVYCIEKKKDAEFSILPIRLTERKREKHVNLLYVQDPRDDNVGHFAWIKNLSRLASSQLSKKKHKKYFCDRCLHYFSSSEKLEVHVTNCQEMNDCAIRLPSEDDKWLGFGNSNRKERLPFVLYADLECVLRKTDSDPMTSTYTFQHHEVFSVGYYMQCSYDETLSAYRSYRGADCIAWFADELEKLAHRVKDIISTNVPMANLTLKDTTERSDSRSDIKLRFIDSYKFLSTSLEKLASFLDKDKLKILRSKFSALSDHDFELLMRKGVFPYEYVDCVDKLQDTRLPPRESFYRSLTGDTVSESDYAHAANVWQRFSIRTLGEYSDLYLKTDVLLLADIFENFRDSYIKSYGLDPAYYYTLPGFTWDAMFKHTRINFELLTDIDMVMFIERGIRGGLSQCSGRYTRANNKYMPSYDPSKSSSYLLYFDVNNLYGWARCQPLPYAEFQWVEDISNFDVSAIAPDSSTGYILEVDLEYPQSKHDAHADLLFCPTRD